jgi:hypothetical protein
MSHHMNLYEFILTLVSESASTTRILLDVVDRLQQQSLKTVVECLYDPLGGQEDGRKGGSCSCTAAASPLLSFVMLEE